MSNFCINCRYHEATGDHMCARTATVDPVTGKRDPLGQRIPCGAERATGECGPRGAFFIEDTFRFRSDGTVERVL